MENPLKKWMVKGKKPQTRRQKSRISSINHFEHGEENSHHILFEGESYLTLHYCNSVQKLWDEHVLLSDLSS